MTEQSRVHLRDICLKWQLAFGLTSMHMTIATGPLRTATDRFTKDILLDVNLHDCGNHPLDLKLNLELFCLTLQS